MTEVVVAVSRNEPPLLAGFIKAIAHHRLEVHLRNELTGRR